VLRIYENYGVGWHIVLFVQRGATLETIVHCALIDGDEFNHQHFAAGKTRPPGHFDSMVKDYPYVWRLLMVEEHV
jgi:hypothetical protein